MNGKIIRRNIPVAVLVLLLVMLSVSTLAAHQVFAVPAPKCGDSKPSDTPRIRKVYAKPTHAILYHTAVAKNNTYYFISYGFASGDERFGAQFDYGATSGRWISYRINSLAPNTTYFFKIRGGNGCKPGNWSNWVGVKTPLQGSKIYNYGSGVGDSVVYVTNSTTTTMGGVTGTTGGGAIPVSGVNISGGLSVPGEKTATEEGGVLGTGSAEVRELSSETNHPWWENGWLVFLIIALGGAAGFFLWRRHLTT